MKVTAILKGRIDSNGQQAIQIRVAKGKERHYYPTYIKLEPDQFHKGKIKNHPKASEYNQMLKNLIIQHQAKALEGFEKKIPKIDLYDYINECMAQRERTRQPGTVRQYNSQIEKLKGFCPSLLLTDVTPEFLYRYQNYLYKDLGNEKNTVWGAFKFLRWVTRKAKKEGFIKDYPFDNFEFPSYEDPDKVYLTKEELKRIEKVLEDADEELLHIGTWFLIACMTGLRLQDIRAFDRKKNIIQGRLVVKTQKTKEVIGLPVNDKLRALFERVNYMPLGMTGENYNRLLKALMLSAKVKKNVSSHNARHTAAITMADAGISQEVVAKILGHKDLRSTAIYYKISNKRIDQEFNKLED